MSSTTTTTTATTTRMYLGLRVKLQIFLLDWNQIWIFSTDFRKKSKILSKSVQLEPRWCTRSDGRT